MWEAIAGVLSGAANVVGQVRANRDNKDMAYQQMNFQRDMSNTSYQRAVADMQSAGLNPMLAYSQGGASTPSGASSTSQPVEYGSLLSSAMQNRVLETGIAKTAAETDQAKAQTAMAALQADQIAAGTRLANANAMSQERMLDAQIEALTGQNKLRASDIWRRQGDDRSYDWARDQSNKQMAADTTEKEYRGFHQRATMDADIARFLAKAQNEELTARQDSRLRREYPSILPFVQYAPTAGGAAVAAAMLRELGKSALDYDKGPQKPGEARLRPNLDTRQFEQPFMF